MTREDFIAAQEQICEDFAFDRITRDQAQDRLSRLGFSDNESTALLREAPA